MHLISNACNAGARKSVAARLSGLTIRTLQRWEKNGVKDKRKDSRATPSNKMPDGERQQIIKTLGSPQFEGLSPNQIVPKLADQGIYIGSESTMYRILRDLRMDTHRHASRPCHKVIPVSLSANGPNQLWSWDITYLPSVVKGRFYYLYMIVDLYSRKAVGCQVYESESGDLAADLITDTCLTEKISKKQVILHSDNGSPMKSLTMLAKLQDLGVMPSFSRPSVSNDNPFSESLFKTLKYRPDYPEKGFDNIAKARDWAHRFVNWYNTEHLHSGIRFVTPENRHAGRDHAILANRQRIYHEARLRHPERWSQGVKNWQPDTEVVLKKFKRLRIKNNVEKKAA